MLCKLITLALLAVGAWSSPPRAKYQMTKSELSLEAFQKFIDCLGAEAAKYSYYMEEGWLKIRPSGMDRFDKNGTDKLLYECARNNSEALMIMIESFKDANNHQYNKLSSLDYDTAKAEGMCGQKPVLIPRHVHDATMVQKHDTSSYYIDLERVVSARNYAAYSTKEGGCEVYTDAWRLLRCGNELPANLVASLYTLNHLRSLL